MDLSLKDAVSIMDVVKTLNQYTVLLWFSLIVPVYYITIKKVLPETPAPDNSAMGLLAKANRMIALPKFEPYAISLALVLFVVGTLVAMRGQQQQDKIRDTGWTLKNYMVNTGYTRMHISDISLVTKIDTNDIKKVARRFPNEFSITYGNSGKTGQNNGASLQICDSLTKINLLDRSEKILATYLNNPAVLEDNGIKPFDEIFSQNNLFSYSVIYRLIADSGYRFTFNLVDPKDSAKGFGVVKIKRGG